MSQNSNELDLSSINSKEYWDQRFADDWELNHGQEQSRFFSRLALKHLPSWLIHAINSRDLSVCDWGCAQGDGTDVLAEFFPGVRFTGVDFSREAIERAVKAYPRCEFLCDDFLAAQSGVRFDVLFSSNTLEHFIEPWSVLTQVAARARDFLVLLLPFREYDRIQEHFSTIDFCNVPLAFDGWVVMHSEVIDASTARPNYWNGEQILLVYGRPERAQELGLSLAETMLQTPNVGCGTQSAYDAAIAERDHARAELARIEAVMASIVAERDAAQAGVERTIAARDAALEVIKHMRGSHSWRITAPLRFAMRLARYGFVQSDRNKFKHGLRPIYDRLPLPAKKAVKWTYRRFATQYHAIRRHVTIAAQFIPPAIKPALRNDAFPDYIVWGVIDWHFRHQRPQQLAQALARLGRRVFYVSVNLKDDERPGFEMEALDSEGYLFQIRLFAKGAPVIYTSSPSIDVVSQIRRSIGEVLDWADSQKAISLVQHPFWYDMATVLPNSRTVYDCMDHHEGFGNTAPEIVDLERALFRNTDLTITTSQWLDQTVSEYTNRRVLIRNAGDFDFFSVQPSNIYRDAQGRRIIGYYGAIAEWFDQDLVEAVAHAFPECCILLIGADSVNAQRRLGKLPNVKFTGEVPYKDLPHFLYGFDVCMLPFRVIPLTLATNPVKVYEYLSAGKPVVSVDLPEIAQCEGMVSVGSTPDAFLRCLATELAAEASPEAEARRRSFAAGQTWGHRVKQLIAEVEGRKDEPLISVIVVTYNNLPLTKTCLASIDAYSDYDNLEIVVVDNASSDGSPAYLSEWVKDAPNRKLILNADNRGFAAGNNQGLAAASGAYLVLLNNDTHVTPGWVRTMMRHLQRDPNIGLIGPVTNNIGNEAKIEIDYEDMQQMLEKSAFYTRRHLGKTFRLHTAAFFCVMMPRAIYEQIGPLDEAFGRGFFEDDDYCRRVEQLGKKIACAEDVFIHHHLSASFNKLKSKERQALFDQNRALYESKWGKWSPHTYERKGAGRGIDVKEHSSISVDAFRTKPVKNFPGSDCIEGFCVVCGRDTKFYFADKALWRESLTCGVCLTTSRYRSVARGLLDAVADLAGVRKNALSQLAGTTPAKKLRVYDTQPPFYYEPCSYPIPDLLKTSGWIDVSLSQFRPHLEPGTFLSEGITNQNLECLTYDDESLDIVITSDVMEHVRLDDRAHREIFRVLRPGGFYIFTVPHDLSWQKTLTRVQIVDEDNPSRDVHLLEPEYHGDTNNEKGEGVLAYRTYGRDLVSYLSDLGFVVQYTKDDLPSLGILNTELFYCRKPV